jgi:septum formation protein
MIHQILQDIPVVLASASPRRAQLFSLLGIVPKIVPAEIAEPLTDDAPEEQAILHATNKAAFVASLESPDSLVVAADTVVAIDRHVLGKPQDAAEAKRYLQLLSGHRHTVFTGICLRYQSKILTAFEQTDVHFAPLGNAEIEAYVSTGEPMDKAGAYGIQGYGAQFITRVEGCYFNVMGFPIRLFYSLLQKCLEVL